MSAQQCGTLGIVGVAGYLLANVALHFLDPNLSMEDARFSDYALGEYGWLSRASDFSAAVASGLFATDGSEATESTTEGHVHAISGIVSILALVVAAWMFRGVFSSDNGYKQLSRTQHWFAVVLTGALVGGIVLEGVAPGLAQRVFAVVMVGWWFVLAVNVRRSDMSRHLSEHATRT